MPLSGCSSPIKPSESKDSESPPAKVVEECKKDDPGQDTKVTGNRIDIVFDPDKSKKVKKCERIVHVQFDRMYADGKVIKPSDWAKKFKFQDSFTTSDGWGVDALESEKTPDYQQGTGDGKKNGGTAKAKISDAPNSPGGDKGFYDSKTNPTGWKSYRLEFSTFAYCMKGDDCGKWYEGVAWEYVKTWEDNRDGKKGIAKIVNQNLEGGPSKSQIEAFDKFNAEKGFKPCK